MTFHALMIKPFSDHGFMRRALVASVAHPHVWVPSSAQLVFTHGTITAVRSTWTFDEMYSAFASQGLDANVYDVKAPFAEYERITEVPGSGEKARAGLEMVAM